MMQLNTLNPSQFTSLIDAIKTGGGSGGVPFISKQITYQGVTINAYKYGMIIFINAMGTPTETWNTSSAYKTIPLGSEFACLNRTIKYLFYNVNRMCQMQLTTSGDLQIGYSRNVNTGTLEDINPDYAFRGYTIDIGGI